MSRASSIEESVCMVIAGLCVLIVLTVPVGIVITIITSN